MFYLHMNLGSRQLQMLTYQVKHGASDSAFLMNTQVIPDVIALQTILPVLSFTTLNSVDILNSLGQEMSYVGWHSVMLNASLQR